MVFCCTLSPLHLLMERWGSVALTQGLGQQVACFSIHQVTLGLRGFVNTDTLEKFQQRKGDANSRDMDESPTTAARNYTKIKVVPAAARRRKAPASVGKPWQSMMPHPMLFR